MSMQGLAVLYYRNHENKSCSYTSTWEMKEQLALEFALKCGVLKIRAYST